ncbi:methyl-accepting chemotaxis protein [Anaeromyxobacter sp. SG17]|uniref:methyl-accepting chemotaxis protein n=1 Tax=Anaeromyxobacter sp. SG17 TaxID=2925405 RepID=UPI001F57DBED|nr:methyl-accepting chemotaxis protein [Anaeromyxobacter sp. SG17]
MNRTESPSGRPRWRRGRLALPLRWGILLVGGTALAAGAASARLPSGSGLAVMGVALAAVLVAATHLARPAERLAAAARAAVRGDLTRPLVPEGAAEVRRAGRDLDALRLTLGATLDELSKASAQLAEDSSLLAGGVSRQSALAARQSAVVAETSTTAAEIAQTARAAALHAEEVVEVAQRSEDLSAEGQQVLERTVETIRSLAGQVQTLSRAIADQARRSRHIGEIVAGLKDLAEQTSLLALNASIEAVKAGDRGRGFSVVAVEMGNLAEQSTSAAGDVRGILAEIEKGTQAAMQVAEEGTRRAHGAMELAADAAKAISGLTRAIRDSSLSARQIANNTRQQGIGVEQIVAAMSDLSSASEEAVAGTEVVERATASLSSLAARLGEATARTRREERA